MCAAGIYGKVMADSCPGNDDNTRENQSGVKKAKKKNIRERRSRCDGTGSAYRVAMATSSGEKWRRWRSFRNAPHVHQSLARKEATARPLMVWNLRGASLFCHNYAKKDRTRVLRFFCRQKVPEMLRFIARYKRKANPTTHIYTQTT